jgi:hypothetical protein
VEVLVKLYKATGHEMDPLAVLEGLKPVVDGLEASGLLVNDRLVIGGWAEALKAGSRDECRVEVTLLAVAPSVAPKPKPTSIISPTTLRPAEPIGGWRGWAKGAEDLFWTGEFDA